MATPMFPSFANAQKRRKCSVGCPIIDRFLGGGIPCGSLTEVVGESGAGKTQLALQLCLAAQLPVRIGGLFGSSLYIHTDHPFPLRRLCQMAVRFAKKHAEFYGGSVSVMDLVFVEFVDSAQELMDLLYRAEMYLSKNQASKPIRVIVVDSMAALFRSQFESNATEMYRRTCLFFKIAGLLKRIAAVYDVAILISNQVVACFGGETVVKIGNMESMITSGRKVSAALGLSWANCVNTRLFLSISNQCLTRCSTVDYGVRGVYRQMNVIFSPHLPDGSCHFSIGADGLVGSAT